MKFLIASLILFFALQTQAQFANGNYGNEWVNHQQTYYKIKVAQDGMQRISAETLQNAGFPVGANCQNLQLFYNGQEVAIDVQSDQGALNHLAFYGQRNQGQLDEHYYSAGQQLNPAYSLFNDTAAYFLTLGNDPGLRYNSRMADFNGLPAPLSHCQKEQTLVFSSTWSEGRTYNLGGTHLSRSIFEIGEGFGSALNKLHDFSIPCPKVYAAGGSAQLDIQLFSSS
jgi:hypothetical protein